MSVWWIMAVALVTAAWPAGAEDVVIESDTVGGTVRFHEIPDATTYRIEWAPATGGVWTNLPGAHGQWLDSIPARGSGIVTAAVPTAFRVVAVLPDVALVPSGIFGMGIGDVVDRRQVTLTRSFVAHKTEVTNRQMADVLNWALARGRVSITNQTVRNTERDQQTLLEMNFGPSQITWDGSQLVVDSGTGDYPVVHVTWYGAQAYCNYLSDREGLNRAISFVDWSMNLDANGYRLPTEAEWEYACRAGTTTDFHTGDLIHEGDDPVDPNLDAAGWYNGNSGRALHPVGRKQANAWGLYDMHGNVGEWCWDWFWSYSTAPVTDPTGPAIGGGGSYPIRFRSSRGGSKWSYAEDCRSGVRWSYGNPGGSASYLGFRPVRSVIP